MLQLEMGIENRDGPFSNVDTLRLSCLYGSISVRSVGSQFYYLNIQHRLLRLDQFAQIKWCLANDALCLSTGQQQQHENSFRLKLADTNNNEVAFQPEAGKQCLRLMSVRCHVVLFLSAYYVISAASVAITIIVDNNLLVTKLKRNLIDTDA